MKRKFFYELSRDAYLLSREASAKKEHEEPVRQWCAHELIRAYSVCIADLSFEAPVRVGSVNYRIDILIRREGAPWIVVECKKRDYREHNKAMEQAISYADSPRIQAEFAVYTNGDVWLVKRRIATGWVSVIDLPIINGFAAAEELVNHLRVLDTLKPLLRTLDTPQKGTAAAQLMKELQEFFNGSISWCSSLDRELLIAADNLLRVLAMSADNQHYRMGKLSHAAHRLDTFAKHRQLHDISLEIDTGSTVDRELQLLHVGWLEFVIPSSQLQAADLPLAHLITALLDYGRNLPSSPRKFPETPPAFHSRLRDFLDTALILHFGLRLPDVGDQLLMSELKGYCKLNLIERLLG